MFSKIFSVTYCLLLLSAVSVPVIAQDKPADFENKILKHFRKESYADSNKVSRKNLYVSPYKGKFKVSVGDQYINLDTSSIVIRNPHFSTEYEEADNKDDRTRNFPRSYSVIYENRLVSLFENGKFSCFKLENLASDPEMEHQLNTKKFKSHWIINNQLGGLAGNTIYLWCGTKWIKSKSKFPLKNQPILFEDDSFIVYSDCFGEFGGTAYFFEKSTTKTFFTESTCANTVLKDEKGYNLLADLGHGLGSVQIKTIPDPAKLTLLKANNAGLTTQGKALGYSDKSNAYQIKLDQYGVQVFSMFQYQGRTLYIVHVAELTFVAELNGDRFEIVNPLFFNSLYTHNPITTRYGDYTLINLDHYGTGLEREISLLLLKGNTIKKIDWNEKHEP